MKTRNQAKRHRQSTGEADIIGKTGHDTKANDSGTLANTSQEGVSNFLKQVGSRGSKGYKRKSKNLDGWSKEDEKQIKASSEAQNILENSSPLNTNAGSPQQNKSELDNDLMDDSDWEDGSNPNLISEINHQDHINKDISIEFEASPGTSKRKPVRRASAEEKEVAELVHRTHLLCLLGRGRLIDKACDDPLIQAALLSLLPPDFLKLSEITNLTVDSLTPVVNWFHSNFHVTSSSSEGSFHLSLSKALETHQGTPEEVAALSVAMFRSLNLLTRFVSILDATSLKPDADKPEEIFQGRKTRKGIFESSTVMVTQPNQASTSSGHQKVNKSSQTNSQDTNSPIVDQSKRKSDIEFEMQMEMALSATAAQTSELNMETDIKNLNNISPFKKLKKVNCKESSSISTAIGSKKIGAPIYWAEVYCNGENSTGKWVHVDATNAIINGEHKVEAAAAACKTLLRYVVAFSGQGAKDVTRRYCAKWYKIGSHRVNSLWWDEVLLPLKKLESRATIGTCHLPEEDTRTSLEDMELETKALTEPLPTNQQAYKSHHLYALERWLTKYQILHPKGPVLGFCSGHPVYPRACVQMLHTKERWMREGLQLKLNELPVKVLKRSAKVNKGKVLEADDDYESNCVGPAGNIELYGKWQTEPLRLIPAKNGIVPKNERGQIDLWSEKCLPPGTVHLGFPRIFTIAKKLGIDYAPAMVGFEFRSGRSIPIYNGMVVCSEFKDVILEAYAEEEERRGAEERRKNEAQALSRWYQLLSSIITRQRLNNRYAEGNSSCPSNNNNNNNIKSQKTKDGLNDSEDVAKPMFNQENEEDGKHDDVAREPEEDHEHVFLTHDGSFDSESCIRTKRCHCGFSIEVEEL